MKIDDKGSIIGIRGGEMVTINEMAWRRRREQEAGGAGAGGWKEQEGIRG